MKAIFKLLPKKTQKYLKVNFLYKYISRNQLLVDESELGTVYETAIRYLSNFENQTIGDYLEFGVYNGTSISLMYNALTKTQTTSTRLFGFDSFEGLPALDADDSDSIWHPGQFKCDYNTAIDRIKKRGVDLSRVHLVKGFYSDTLNADIVDKHQIKHASIIMIDCDMYSSTKEALNFCKPLLGDMAIIIFDDWHILADKNMGEKKAFEEFMALNDAFKYSFFADYKFKGRDVGRAFLVERH